MPQAQRSGLVDEVYEAIKSLIMNHRIAPGERVGIDALARELDVSPTPVREALIQLDAERLVHKEPLRGYRTTPVLTREELQSLFEFRHLLEPWAAEIAAVTDDESAHRAVLDEFDNRSVTATGTRYRDHRGLTEHDQRFHHLIFVASGNPFAVRSFDSLHSHLEIFRLHHGASQGSDTISEHAAIVNAVRARDGDAARDAMMVHLDAAFDRAIAFTESKNR